MCVCVCVYACVFSEVFHVVAEDKYLVGCDTMQCGGCNLWHSEHCAASVISTNELLYWLIWPVLLKCQYISTRLHGVTSQGCFLYLYSIIYHCFNVIHCVCNAHNFPNCLQMAGPPDCLLHSDYLICSSHKSLSHNKDIQMTVKTQQIYCDLLLHGYTFRLLRVVIRPSNEPTQDYLIPSALWDARVH